MDKIQLQSEGLIKEEKIGFLKSKLQMHPGVLFLTNKRIVCETTKPTVTLGGIAGLIISLLVKNKPKTIFDIENKTIQSVTQGKHGLAKNILEISDMNNNTYKILVKSYPEWEELLKKATGKTFIS